jgi:hypothetical protein
MAFPASKSVPVMVKLKLVIRGHARNCRCEQVTTEHISAAGFLGSRQAPLVKDKDMDVYLIGQDDRYVGNLRLVRIKALGTSWAKYGFQCLETNQDWLI